MSELAALSLAREFKDIDRSYSENSSRVEDLIAEGYSPDDALMLAGFGGYNS